MADEIIPAAEAANFIESDIIPASEAVNFVEAGDRQVEQPGFLEGLKAGFLQRDIKTPPGLDYADTGKFIGEEALPIAGAVLGAPAGPAGSALGAAAGRSVQKAIGRGLEAMGFVSDTGKEEESPLAVVADVALTGALQRVGEAALDPAVIKAAGKLGGKVRAALSFGKAMDPAEAKIAAEAIADELMLPKAKEMVADVLGGTSGAGGGAIKIMMRFPDRVRASMARITEDIVKDSKVAIEDLPISSSLKKRILDSNDPIETIMHLDEGRGLYPGIVKNAIPGIEGTSKAGVSDAELRSMIEDSIERATATIEDYLVKHAALQLKPLTSGARSAVAPFAAAALSGPAGLAAFAPTSPRLIAESIYASKLFNEWASKQSASVRKAVKSPKLKAAMIQAMTQAMTQLPEHTESPKKEK